jgi:hypothetical protein
LAFVIGTGKLPKLNKYRSLENAKGFLVFSSIDGLGAFLPLLARSFLETIGPIWLQIAADFPEKDTAEPLLHGPLGPQGKRFGIVIADHRRTIGSDGPGGFSTTNPLFSSSLTFCLQRPVCSASAMAADASVVVVEVAVYRKAASKSSPTLCQIPA